MSEPCDWSHTHVSPFADQIKSGKMKCGGCEHFVTIYSYTHKRYGKSWALSNHCKDGTNAE